MKKTFHFGDVLTVYSGIGVGPGSWGAVVDILSFLTGAKMLGINQLPRVADECNLWLKKRYPVLDQIDCTTITNENQEQWMIDVCNRYNNGSEDFVLETLPAGSVELRHPVDELREQMGESNVVVISVPLTKSDLD